MDLQEIINVKIEKDLWHFASVQRGRLSIRFGAPDVILAAYAAMKIRPYYNCNNLLSFANIVKESVSDRAVRDYLLNDLPESWQEIAFSLAKSYTEEELKSFVATFDAATDGGPKNASEFGTPEGICKLAYRILDIKKNEIVADLACGRGDFLCTVAENDSAAQLVGIEINNAVACVARVRLELLGADAEVVTGNIFANEEAAGFNKVFSNFPFGMRVKDLSGNGRFLDSVRRGETNFGRPHSADWAFNMRAFESLADDGTAVTIMTCGAGFNGADERARRHFIVNDMIKAVIALPARLFPSTAIATLLVVLGKNEGAIRMVDATDLSVPGRRWDVLGDDEIEEIIIRFNGDGVYSRLVEKGEIAKADFILNPARYLGREIELRNPVPLDKLAKIERGAPLSAGELDVISTNKDTGIRFLRIGDISDGRIGDDLLYLKELDSKYEKSCLETGDLVISKSGAPYKIAVAEVHDGETILANGNLYILRFDQKQVDPYYVLAFLVSEDGKELLERAAVGTSLPNLPIKNLRDFCIPVIPLEEQEVIAQRYKACLDEIEVLKIKLEKARIDASSVYDDEVAN